MEQNPTTMATRHKAVDAYYRLGSLKKAAKEVAIPSRQDYMHALTPVGAVQSTRQGNCCN